jgi:hypothetical protein
MKMTNSNHRFLFAASFALVAFLMLIPSASVDGRPVSKKGGNATPQAFFRQRNTLSNLDFFFTNKGILFNNDVGEGLFYPRGTTNFYIFGGGLWFATKKNIGGHLRKLCELGYNPNSGVGWFSDGETNAPSGNTEAEYVSYVSPRYKTSDGSYDGIPRSSVTGSAHWPIWDTASTKTLNHNYYFGDYIADENQRVALAIAANGHQALNGKIPKPAMLSQEEIVNIYTDQDVTQNPEYRAGIGYPFGLNVVEVIYSWSFGRYRDMIFVRRKVTNASKDNLTDCFMSAAFDPDLGATAGDEQYDDNSFFGLTPADLAFCQKTFPIGSPYHDNPFALNMAEQWKTIPPKGVTFGVIGFTFLESPVTAPNGNILDISDSASVGGYCNLNQLGINTYRRWSITNDPPTPDLRYDFQSSGTKDGPLGAGADQRMLFSTGPFNLPPSQSVEYVIGIGIAWPSTTTLQANKDSCVKLIAFAHSVFADTTGSYHRDSVSCTTEVKSFVTPGPPDVPTITTTCLDRAVLIQWDNAAELTKNPLSTTLAFNTYDLYRTSRSDHDSTIRPDGINPTVHLGSWSIWNFRQDSTFDTVKVGTLRIVNFAGFKYTRTNTVPNQIPHSFLDVGDDNGDGMIEGNEGLFNGVKYYYFLLATNEYDSINKVGPLTTSIVNQKNFAIGSPCKPVFPDLPNVIAGDSSCLNGAIGSSSCGSSPIYPTAGTTVSLEIQDTGKFLQLYANDTVYVSFQPRWTEYNARFVNQSIMNMNVDVTETRQGKVLTYDKLFNPNATPAYTPYSFPSGIVEQVLGQQCDSNIAGKFSTNNSMFAPFQTIDQAFDILVNHEYRQLNAPYKLKSISADPAKIGIIHISGRTSRAPQGATVDYSNIDTSFTYPSYLGALGQASYDITFGQPVQWSELQADTNGKVFTQSDIKDPNSSADFQPTALPVTIVSTTHCNAPLSVIRAGNRNDISVENDYQYYDHTKPGTGNTILPDYSQPDTMIVPLAGKFAMDAFHYSEPKDGDPTNTSFMTKTTGMYYFSHGLQGYQNSGKFLNTVHRLRLAGAEIMLNFPGISDPSTGDSGAYTGPTASNDFQPGDKISVSFTGLMSGLPFPGTQFMIETSKGKRLDFTDNSLYEQSKILSEVQVVPNPYIVNHLGQTSTDNAKLYFTRLPPRATIEIYNIAGELVKTLHHIGFVAQTDANGNITGYDFNTLADRYNVEEWNLLSEGNQRVGSQVFVARVIALDPKTGSSIAETTTKFAVVLGGFHIVH